MRCGQPAKTAARAAESGSSSKTSSAAPPSCSFAQSRADRCLVDDAAARRVDQDRARFHARERRAIDEIPGARRQRNVEGDDVGGCDELVEVEAHDAARGLVPGRVLGRHERVVRGDGHVEGRGALCGLARDRAEADEAEALAGDLMPHQPVAGPSPGDHVRGRGIGAAQEHHRGRDDVFGDGDVVRAGRRVDRDAARLAGGEVDIVETDAEAADALQLGRALEQRRSDEGSVANDERARIGHGRREVGRPVDEGRIVERVEAREALADRGFIHEFGDDDLGHRLNRSGQGRRRRR